MQKITQMQKMIPIQKMHTMQEQIEYARMHTFLHTFLHSVLHSIFCYTHWATKTTLKYTTIPIIPGITNTIGRVLAGFLADFQQINSLFLHNNMMILGGMACILNMFATTYQGMIAFCAFFGLSVGKF